MIEQASNVGLELMTGSLFGVLLGIIYFRCLKQSVESFSEQGAILKLAAGTFLRVGIAVVAFVIIMQWSALAALSGLVSFSIARGRAVMSGGLI